MKNKWFIIALILFSLALRIYKIDANLPHTYWHDENNNVETALRFGTGNLRPHTLEHGMLLPMILFVEYGVYYLIKRLAFTGYITENFLTEYIMNPTNFYLISRITVALFGIACIWLVYLISLRLYNKRTANISSLLFSLSLVPFIQSKWTKACTISVFFLLLAFLMCTHLLLRTGKSKKSPVLYYLLSGFFIGLATAAKLYALFGFSFVLLAHLFAYDQDGSRGKITKYLRHLFDGKLMISGVFLVIGFILGDSYAVINPKFFYENLLFMQNAVFDTSKTVHLDLYLTSHFKDVFGSAPLTILIFISVIFFIIKRSKKEIALLVYPIVLFLFYVRYPGFAHYLIPVVPFLAIAAASFLEEVFKKVPYPKRQVFIWGIIIIALCPSFLNIWRFNILISKPDTRTIAKEWIEKNIPQGSSILLEGCISTVPIQVPQLKGNLDTLERDSSSVKSSGGKGSLIDYEIKCIKNDKKTKRYNIFKVRITDVDALKKVNPDYVILSGYVEISLGEFNYLREKKLDQTRKELYAELGKNYRLIQVFKPYPELGNYFPLLLIDDFKKLGSIGLLKGRSGLLQGPEIKIYRKVNINERPA